MKKFLLGVTMALSGALALCALTACAPDNGDGGEPDAPGVKTAVFEAEGVDLSMQSGRGWSNEAHGCQMIQGKNVAKIRDNKNVVDSISNGYFVGFLGIEGTELVFEIESDAAVSEATLVLRLASEWGTMTVDSSIMKIEVNDENVAYNAFTVTGKKIEGASAIEYGVPFADFTISSKIALKEGTNVIKLITQGKTYGETAIPYGPGVDCIKIKSTANLTWESLWEDNQLNVKEQ